jgi:chorismate mutase/prephenate dehydrogenase
MTLSDLRTAISDVDASILELVARRQALARAVEQAKEADASAIRDFTREREVLHRARETAAELGISGDVAEELMTCLIRYSLSVQERQRVARSGGGSGRRALVIGGAGRMGSWFAEFLASQGYTVEIADPVRLEGFRQLEDWRASPLDHDFIVVATDLRTTRSILTDLAERRPSGIIFDIGSLKSPLRDPLRAMAQSGLAVTSIHPMFGPGTDLLSGRHVILVDLGRTDANRGVERLFASTMATVVHMDLETHDRTIAYILGLSHAVNISFFTSLAESGEAAASLAHLSSTTFDRQLAVAADVAEENPHLYFEIQHLNDYGSEALSALSDTVERLQSIVRAGDEAAFVTLMERGRTYLEQRTVHTPQRGTVVG